MNRVYREEKEAIVSYWGNRSQEFARLRREELASNKAGRWKKEILPYLPVDRKSTRILDVGTGSGFFPILLATEGYEQVTGIDLTPKMIEEAKHLSAGMVNQPSFYVMDAEHPDFTDESFDVIVTRNLTWTLPNLEQAYREWYRILKKGGILLNFDADYGCEQEEKVELPANHAHFGIAEELMREHERIMTMLPNTYMNRPGVDIELLRKAGFAGVNVDFLLSDRIYREIDEFYNPVRLFALRACKQ